MTCGSEDAYSISAISRLWGRWDIGPLHTHLPFIWIGLRLVTVKSILVLKLFSFASYIITWMTSYGWNRSSFSCTGVFQEHSVHRNNEDWWRGCCTISRIPVAETGSSKGRTGAIKIKKQIQWISGRINHCLQQEPKIGDETGGSNAGFTLPTASRLQRVCRLGQALLT